MGIRRFVATVCWGIGLSSLAAATSAQLAAVDCDPELWSPATCLPAHADMPVQGGAGAYCHLDASNDCVPEQESLCVASYATAVPGECQPEADYSNPSMCTENYGITVVEVDRYEAACRLVGGVCRCEFTRDTAAPPALIEVCQCAGEAN